MQGKRQSAASAKPSGQSVITLSNYIGGELLPPAGKQYLDSYEPATGRVLAQVPDSTEQDVAQAVEGATKAFPVWSRTPVAERAAMLQRIADDIERRLDNLAEDESRDNGKPLWLARKVDIPRAVSNFRFFAAGCQHFASEAHPMEDGTINYTLRRPLGVVGCISPWNLPLYLFTWKIAPALATGNCVVAKPSEVTPLTAFRLSEICREAGLPPGVLNIVHGYGHKVGTAITDHDDVRAITFTGSTRTGKAIARKAAPAFKKLSLEMGGKNPNIIFADCDFDKMLTTTMRSSFANQGQICLCGSRIFVQRPVYEKFKNAFIARTKKITVGDPMEEDTKLGAVASKEHQEKILSYIELAQREGGKILCGGEALKLKGRCAGGYFVTPTIIEGLPQACRTNREEIFGPVVTIIPFENEEEVIGYANDVEYGLSATVWTENLNRAHRVAERLESGIIWVNCWLLRDLRTPFGGMKSSGVGREGGWEVFRFFTEAKNVCIQVP